MSDLISRSELLIAMDTWDKFGYDEHNRLIKIDRTNEEYVPYVHYEDMVKCVNDMPTAYDIDKVIEELNELDVKSITRYKNGNFGDFDGVEYYIKKRDAIEIVKHGGLSDDVCEWKLTDTKKLMTYEASCGNEDLYDNSYKYCPYCGKKIKVVVE